MGADCVWYVVKGESGKRGIIQSFQAEKYGITITRSFVRMIDSNEKALKEH